MNQTETLKENNHNIQINSSIVSLEMDCIQQKKGSVNLKTEHKLSNLK
jgi:hypothetical protein